MKTKENITFYIKFLKLYILKIITFLRGINPLFIVDIKYKKLIRTLNIKFIIFFIISFIFLLFFWYYISMFGAIYMNTQFHLLKDTLMSFGLSLIYPFIINLLPGIFRIPSLSEPNKQRKYLYKLSKMILTF